MTSLVLILYRFIFMNVVSLIFFSFTVSALIVTGKILNDDIPLKEYKIDEKNFVVVMVTKVSVYIHMVY